MKGKRILIAESNPAHREAFEKRFLGEGAFVCLVSSGDEAVYEFLIQRPDLVILDFELDGGGGLPVFERMLSLDESVPVIVTSEVERFSEDGSILWFAVDCVGKSEDLDRLMNVARKVLAQPVGETSSLRPKKSLHAEVG